MRCATGMQPALAGVLPRPGVLLSCTKQHMRPAQAVAHVLPVQGRQQQLSRVGLLQHRGRQPDGAEQRESAGAVHGGQLDHWDGPAPGLGLGGRQLPGALPGHLQNSA
jgi:hypothetical protein